MSTPDQDAVSYVYENIKFGTGEGFVTGMVRYCGDETARPRDAVTYTYENIT